VYREVKGVELRGGRRRGRASAVPAYACITWHPGGANDESSVDGILNGGDEGRQPCVRCGAGEGRDMDGWTGVNANVRL
jgi:hypothetical protein